MCIELPSMYEVIGIHFTLSSYNNKILSSVILFVRLLYFYFNKILNAGLFNYNIFALWYCYF